MSIIRSCEFCSTKFVSLYKYKVRRFCSNVCRVEQKRTPMKKINCIRCGKETNNPKFCSQTCAGIYNNAHKDWTKIKTGPPPKLKNVSIVKFQPLDKSNKIIESEIIGPYSKLYINKCAKTGIIFCSKSYQKYHPSTYTERQLYSRQCKFLFSISQFPMWFNGNIITQYGWYSTPGSRKGIKNLNGISRDHMISTNYGYINNIDPKLISHPANCQLIRHEDNNRKNIKCSITLEELINLIKKFELVYPNFNARVPGYAPGTSVLETNVILNSPHP